ncbi:MAG: hypothetical protein AB9856_14540 [Cellulosilyticaceae bacterium]
MILKNSHNIYIRLQKLNESNGYVYILRGEYYIIVNQNLDKKFQDIFINKQIKNINNNRPKQSYIF